MDKQGEAHWGVCTMFQYSTHDVLMSQNLASSSSNVDLSVILFQYLLLLLHSCAG